MPPLRAFPAAAAAVASAALASSIVSGQGAPAVRLVDATREAGLSFTHFNGAFGRKYLPETMGAGSAFLDYNGDGRQDVLLVNGTAWPGQKAPAGTWSRLFRNDGNGTFTDVTAKSGLEIAMQGMGVAAADYDNDGFQDLFISAVGQSRLFRNTGRGTFEDVTRRAGLAGREAFSTSVMWFDYDRDGWLDLLVCNYVKWTPETDVYCSADGTTKSYCTPEAYRGSTSWLYRNRGNGTFEDVTAKAGLFDVTSKALGVSMLDHDHDGWPDLFIANDTQPNKLYRNNRNGTFTELGLQAGVAFSSEGRARAGMGADAADIDNTGAISVAVTNFAGEMVGLYTPAGEGQYVDAAPSGDIGRATRQTLGFGCFFFDVDLDGLVDLLVVNGHIDASIARVQKQVHYAEAPHLFHNLGGGRFRDVAKDIGDAFAAPKVGRGAAFGDYDGDGDLDVLLTTNGGPAFLYRNDLLSGNQPIRFRLKGSKSNRDGIGATVRVQAGSSRLSRMVRTGSSYLSQSELPVTFGLGERQAADQVTVEWPSGHVDKLGRLAAAHEYDVLEGKGVVSKRPLRRAVNTTSRQ